ncbi:MAG: hypothetical protein U9R32_01215, partial [Bacteroidota bacterium]|nr:hypothetical protein [Bacteroidota bacterium]
MKHLTITIILFLFIGTTTTAKKHKLSINANSTTTFIPNFDYYVHIATEPIIYDFMDLSNYTHISSSYQEAKTKPKLGFSIDIEYSNRLNKRLSVLFAIGINQMRYEYDTEMNDNGAIYSLTDLDKDYGNTTLYYLNIRPFNYSVSFNENKTSIFGGPILSLLLKSKSCNAVG